MAQAIKITSFPILFNRVYMHFLLLFSDWCTLSPV
jgi:hypothetical protein